MARTDTSSPTDRSNPCPECGGGTYTFASGSVWCPSEACQPGGRFIKRVAFEPSPTKTGVLPLPYPKRDVKAREPKPVTVTPTPVKPADDFTFGSMDAFVSSKESK
jgi:hypothetical protein